jgi:hypothetical protein
MICPTAYQPTTLRNHETETSWPRQCFLSSAPSRIRPEQAKNCDELKMEIAAKIEANGVKSYDLTITKNDEVKNGR